MKYEVRITARARQAIEEYIHYIAIKNQEPINAGRVLEAILAATSTLESMPERCPKAPEDEHVDYTVRMLIVKKTLILLFRIDEEAQVVTVIGFRHGSHSPLRFDQ